jgi:hypothetical protein
MKPYSVAICTHSRSQNISERTLAYLTSANVPPEAIHLFVTPGQESDYARDVPRELYGELHTGGYGLAGNRNSVVQYFPEGHPVVQLDDDVQSLMALRSNGTLTPVVDAHDLFMKAFSLLEKSNATIWGVYPVCNGFFMKNRVSRGLLFCIGQCMGFLNRPSELISVDDKDDYERSLLRYVTDGEVLRLDMITAKAGGVRKNSGGLQNDKRLGNNNLAVQYLKNQYPAFVREKASRPDGYREIRLLNPK